MGCGGRGEGEVMEYAFAGVIPVPWRLFVKKTEKKFTVFFCLNVYAIHRPYT